MQGQPYTEESYIAKVKATYPEKHAEVLKLYPHSSTKEIELSATALASDRFIAYSTWKWFDLHRKNSQHPVYRYLYSKLRPHLTVIFIQSYISAHPHKAFFVLQHTSNGRKR